MTRAREALKFLDNFLITRIQGNDRQHYDTLRDALRLLDAVEGEKLVKDTNNLSILVSRDANHGWNACLERLKQIARGE